MKNRTKADLEKEIENALQTIRATTKEREEAKELANERRINQIAMLKEIGLMCNVRNNFEYQVGDIQFSEIAFRIGELVAIEREYFELKDRMLPMPKSELLKIKI